MSKSRVVVPRMKVPIADRFWAKVDKSGDCWLWLGNKDKDGYGMFWMNGRSLRAHKVSYELEHGSFPEGMIGCHHCDTPSCVRPSHIFPGTYQDNSDDRRRKGRECKGDAHWTRSRPEIFKVGPTPKVKNIKPLPRGENNPTSVLRDNEVLNIRTLYGIGGLKPKILAQLFGVEVTTVRRILVGSSWKHIPSVKDIISGVYEYDYSEQKKVA